MFNTVIVRYGELALKSPGVRKRFEQTLVSNIEAMLDQEKIEYSEVRREWGRIFVESSDSNAAKVVANVFGIVSTSPAITVDATLEASATTCAKVAENMVQDGESFAIRPRRSGNHDFRSSDIGISCGDAVYEKLDSQGKSISVNLTDPDKEIFVEMRQSKAYVFTEIVDGVGGLPLGTQGKMVVLISGGIDSPVAAWMMMRRGVEIIPVYANNAPFANDAGKERTMDCVRALQKWAPGHLMKFYEVPNGPYLEAVREKCNVKNTCIMCKRMMYRLGFEVMNKEKASGIITGSSLGQVASQTTYNMYAEIYGLGFPIYHPLIGLDKTEIMDLAKKIGTYEISIRKAASCGAVPVHPEVRARYTIGAEEDEKLDIDSIVAESMAGTKIHRLVDN
ncbi:thiamine biosynthesis protein ThiI [Methanohalophilus levihalophilus]|uniref:tRNA uracil 4-sulfurtransferase ThiI n=1 Tax=Methanohalophilus levihalophilus TaxID=1431282 RepID=UPI001AE65595|nr:tRNA uracil 4-sulfurtransferase ThiI [Methanohalophilus levihalophilus]MBP2030952.1 thiamine biosynthesis protein ThiI [Methanohalophilus levihalophilus]